MASEPAAKVSCIYCVEEISGLRIRCAACKDVDLCLQCFAAGAEIGTHKCHHPYQFVDACNPALTNSNRGKWTSNEHLQLIIGIQKYGFESWANISEFLQVRTPEEAQTEYYKNFVDGSIGQVTWKRAHEKRETMVDLSKDEPPPPPTNPAIPLLDVSPKEIEILGYKPLRDDFEKEYDNEAEALLIPELTEAAMHTDDQDVATALALAHCDMYTQRLRERFRRKRISWDYQLVSQFFANRRMKFPRRLSGEQEVAEKLKWLCQLRTAQERDCLVKSIQRQRDLQQRLAQLMEYRRNGLTRIEELPHFDQECRSRKGTSSGSSSLASQTAAAKRKSEKNGGNDNFSTTRNSMCHTGSPSLLHRTEPEQQLPLQQQPLLPQSVLCHPVLTEPSKHLLSSTEATLCSNLHLSPSQFITIKTFLLTSPETQGNTTLEKQIRKHIISNRWNIPPIQNANS